MIDIPAAFKFDLFPSVAYPLGAEELERSISLTNTELSSGAAPFVKPEDILLAKLHWYRRAAKCPKFNGAILMESSGPAERISILSI
ncbi:MAG TPA: hypothetical protein VFT60_07850 [Bryobacteraceae bacterium]|nr:hypothetical protein [Bryobacteraceae bacterium]